MKKTLFFFSRLIAFIALLVFGGCDKKEGGELETLTLSEKMLMGDWVKIKRENKLPNQDWKDDLNTSCFLNATEKFNVNRDWHLLTPSTCSSGGVQRGSWTYMPETNRLLINVNGIEGALVRTVTEVNKESLVLTHETGTVDNMISRTYYRRQ